MEKPFEELVQGRVCRVIAAQTKKWRKNILLSREEMGAFIQALRRDKYDIIVDLQGNIKSSLVMAFARGIKKVGFGSRTVPEKINLFFYGQPNRSPSKTEYQARLPHPPGARFAAKS